MARPTSTTDIHAQTSAEVNRQVLEYSACRAEVVRELAAIFAARQAGKAPAPAPLPEPTRKARERAKAMLNGHSPASFVIPSSISRESELEIEREALDLVLGVLVKSEVAARAAEAIQWAREHAGEWRRVCRELLLCACRLRALEEHAANMVNIMSHGATDVPLTEFVGRGLQIEIPGDNLDNAITAGLRERIVTGAEIKDAKNVAAN
jgi:hypothetical protein